MPKKTIIHVNQHIISQNRKNGTNNPPLTIKDYTQNRKGQEAIIYDDNGNEVAKIIHSPDKPLSCGARVWIETKNKVEVFS